MENFNQIGYDVEIIDLVRTEENEYGEDVSNTLKTLIKNKLVRLTRKRDRKQHEIYLLSNYDSPLIKEVFYQNTSPLSGILATKGLVPLEADKPVVGINGCQNNGSVQQGTATPPSCHDWWETGSQGLKYRMVDAMQKSLAINVGHDLNIPHCQNDISVLHDGQTQSHVCE